MLCCAILCGVVGVFLPSFLCWRRPVKNKNPNLRSWGITKLSGELGAANSGLDRLLSTNNGTKDANHLTLEHPSLVRKQKKVIQAFEQANLFDNF